MLLYLNSSYLDYYSFSFLVLQTEQLHYCCILLLYNINYNDNDNNNDNHIIIIIIIRNNILGLAIVVNNY